MARDPIAAPAAPPALETVDAIDGGIFGRDEERSTIEGLLHAESPWTLLIEGEAGIGKSTLLAFAVERLAARGDRVLSWRASEAEPRLSEPVETARSIPTHVVWSMP